MGDNNLIRSLFLFTIIMIVGNAHTVYAATLPSGFTETNIVTGLSAPTAMEFAPDGRLFVLEQRGKVRIIKNPQSATAGLLTAPFITLTVGSGYDQGLMGITFDPNFSSNQFIYLFYTVPGTPNRNRVSRFTASGDVAVPGSERIIIELGNTTSVHNGGPIHFGLDGKLYIGVGDYTTSANGQNLGVLQGKMLRINADGTIPTDNPFVGQTGKRGEIWAYGLRVPFTFAVDPQNGQIFVNDVGADTWEEINLLQKGGNYGWPICEGACSTAGFINPLYQYGRDVGTTITGGTFYRRTQFPSEWHGDYFFSDYSQDWIKVRNPTGSVINFATGINGAVDLKIGADGSLYSLTIPAGVFRYSYSSSKPGDANGDNLVDGRDYIVWLLHYGQNVSGASNGDFDNNNIVDGRDYIVWLLNYGR